MYSLQNTTTSGFQHARPAGTRTGLLPGLKALRSPQRLVVRMSKADEPKENSQGSDSYSRIEAPVRDTAPDKPLYGGKDVNQRDWGQGPFNAELRDNTPEWKPPGSDISAADAMRFTGAIPEVANARLAMVGVVAALVAEIKTGLNVFDQWSLGTGQIVATFFVLTLATAVPVFRGQPRRGNGIFTPDLELVLGRTAMLGFLGIVISSFYKGHALWFFGL